MKKFIVSYPTLFGMVIGLVLVVGIIVMATWYPRVGRAWQRNNESVRSVYFTVGFFAIWISRVWRWHRRNAFVFWASVLALFLLHVVGVVLYSIRVHPLLLWEWIILITFEGFAFVFALDWITRRFANFGEHGHRRVNNNQDQ